MGEWGIAPSFLTSALDGGELSASRPGHFTPDTNWIGGWVGPRCGLDLWRRENLAPARKRTPVVQPVARRHTDWACEIIIVSKINFFPLKWNYVHTLLIWNFFCYNWNIWHLIPLNTNNVVGRWLVLPRIYAQYFEVPKRYPIYWYKVSGQADP
jgi:hypothetical protein